MKIKNLIIKNSEFTNEEKMIILDYIEELEDRDKKLSALEQGGVDNWEWYEESLQDYYFEEEEEEEED